MPTTIEGQLSAADHRYGIVVSRFNGVITRQLLDGALDCLRRHGASENAITVVYCPGSFEIPQVALQLAQGGHVDGIICLGCVMRGETPHFEYIASEVTRGVGHVGLTTGVPTSFGVLTTETFEQALERAGAKAGNKGWDAAMTIIELVNVTKLLSPGRKSSTR
jgi:6,7-dimethyl-8-ribityllumazine synthase